MSWSSELSERSDALDQILKADADFMAEGGARSYGSQAREAGAGATIVWVPLPIPDT